MKLFLFGGAEEGEAAAELKMIEAVIKSINPAQLLHIPFARPNGSSWAEWDGDRFHRNIHIPDMEYLNANNTTDIAKAKDPLVFISGGNDPVNLIDKIMENPLLVDLIHNAQYIIGESAGVKVLGTYYISKNDQGDKVLLPSLGIIKNTVLEGHYTQRNKEPALIWGMLESKSTYGVGIDSCTAMVFELEEFPEKYEKIGDGNIVIKTQ